MKTRICPKCGKMRNERGLKLHLKYCGKTPDVVEKKVQKERYPQQKAIMRPEEYARFLRKAGGG